MATSLAQLDYEDKGKFWKSLSQEIEAILVKELIPNLANISAMIFHQLPDVNWVGFYLFDKDQLVLGPFQGKPACIYIPLGRGVCGTAARNQESIIVPDTSKFNGHIACDPASQSEIVIPITWNNGQLFGVLDIDSPQLNRFSKEDLVGLEGIVRHLESYLNKA